MSTTTHRLMAPLLVLALFGCTTPTKRSLETLYDTQRAAIVKKYAGPGSEDTLKFAAEDRTARNALLNDLILLVDMNFHSSERALCRNKGWADFTGSVAVLGLSAVGTAGSGVAVKTLMNALSGVITGTKTAFDKDVLQNQNILAIITKMRALRAQRLLILRAGMKQEIEAYPLAEGLVDLGEYYQCGNATAALQAIIDSAAAEKDKAETILDQKIRNIPTL